LAGSQFSSPERLAAHPPAKEFLFKKREGLDVVRIDIIFFDGEHKA
jgi:hypothetical protein